MIARVVEQTSIKRLRPFAARCLSEMGEYGHRADQGDRRVAATKRCKDTSDICNACTFSAEPWCNCAFKETRGMDSFDAGPGKSARFIRRGRRGSQLAGDLRQIDGAIEHFASASLKQ